MRIAKRLQAVLVLTTLFVLAALPALADGPPEGWQAPVPEPSALIAFGAGALLLRSALRRR